MFIDRTAASTVLVCFVRPFTIVAIRQLLFPSCSVYSFWTGGADFPLSRHLGMLRSSGSVSRWSRFVASTSWREEKPAATSTRVIKPQHLHVLSSRNIHTCYQAGRLYGTVVFYIDTVDTSSGLAKYILARLTAVRSSSSSSSFGGFFDTMVCIFVTNNISALKSESWRRLTWRESSKLDANSTRERTEGFPSQNATATIGVSYVMCLVILVWSRPLPPPPPPLCAVDTVYRHG